MAAWKLECGACGRHIADFDETGLQLQCRRCKAITTIPLRQDRQPRAGRRVREGAAAARPARQVTREVCPRMDIDGNRAGPL